MDAGLAAVEKEREISAKQGADTRRWKWDLEKVTYWTVVIASVAYAMWSFSTNARNEGLLKHMWHGFGPSPYGLENKQDMTNWGWRTTKFMALEAWKWYLLHPVLARVTAHFAPSLLPVFYATYSSMFVVRHFGWEVLVLFLGQHAAFFAVSRLRIPALCYVVAFAFHFQKFVLSYDGYGYMRAKYGRMPYRAAFVAFHWNLMRGISLSVEFIRAQRAEPDESRRHRWPSYWNTLAYSFYLPTLYMGPPQNYDDFFTQMHKPRPRCTPLEVATCIGRILRSGAHFLLMELMSHYLYSSAMSKWPAVVATIDATSIVGLALSLLFTFYMRYLFTYGFPGALGRAEGFDIPPHGKCIARMSRCSFFWRHFDRGMHLWIRRYVYEPVVGGNKRPFKLVLGAAVAFFFTWAWHGMLKGDAIWCSLSVLGIALEVLAAQTRRWEPVRRIEGRYLASPHRLRVATAVLGAPHFLLTICACLFHLADLETILIICRKTVTGFPFPLVPVLAALYCACHAAMDAEEWEAPAAAKRKQASS